MRSTIEMKWWQDCSVLWESVKEHSGSQACSVHKQQYRNHHLVKISDNFVEQPQAFEAFFVNIGLSVEFLEIWDRCKHYGDTTIGVVVELLTKWKVEKIPADEACPEGKNKQCKKKLWLIVVIKNLQPVLHLALTNLIKVSYDFIEKSYALQAVFCLVRLHIKFLHKCWDGREHDGDDFIGLVVKFLEWCVGFCKAESKNQQ